MERERGREKEGEGGREREREREKEREREGEREREQDEEGGRKRGREEGGKWCKRIQELTYWLQCRVFTPNAWLPSLKASTWVVKICSHSLALACLTTLSCRTKLLAPPDIRPDASRLRMLFIMSSCADGDRSETSPPQTLQQRRAWLMTFHCFSKSTVLFDSPSRKKASWDWRVTQTATVLFESSNLSVSQVLVPPSMSMFFDMSIARPSYRNASQFPWKTDAILAFSQAALRRTFEPP